MLTGMFLSLTFVFFWLALHCSSQPLSIIIAPLITAGTLSPEVMVHKIDGNKWCLYALAWHMPKANVSCSFCMYDLWSACMSFWVHYHYVFLSLTTSTTTASTNNIMQSPTVQRMDGVSFCFILFLFLLQACHTVTNEMGQPGDAKTHMNTFGVMSSSHSRIATALCRWISSPISLPHSGDCLCFVPVASSCWWSLAQTPNPSWVLAPILAVMSSSALPYMSSNHCYALLLAHTCEWHYFRPCIPVSASVLSPLSPLAGLNSGCAAATPHLGAGPCLLPLHHCHVPQLKSWYAWSKSWPSWTTLSALTMSPSPSFRCCPSPPSYALPSCWLIAYHMSTWAPHMIFGAWCAVFTHLDQCYV